MGPKNSAWIVHGWKSQKSRLKKKGKKEKKEMWKLKTQTQDNSYPNKYLEIDCIVKNLKVMPIICYLLFDP